MVRRAQKTDALDLARLCTDSFFGTHAAADGPIIFLQRTVIWGRVLRQVLRRLSIEGEGRECRLIVATDASSGGVRACVDVATHLFDTQRQRFELLIDEMPSGREARRRYGWRPYVASMAVAAADRRRGLGAQLLHEAERTARGWGYREMMLEVAVENANARRFYGRNGYRVISVGAESSGVGATVVRSRDFYSLPYWAIEEVDKCLMRKALGVL